MKDKRIRINKKMVAWSDGQRTNIVPSVRSKVDDYGRMMIVYHTNLDEGYEIHFGSCSVAREESRCREYEADRYWEQGRHLTALKEMMTAAVRVLPDDEPEFEDVHWLDPWENVYWHPNVKEFIRLVRRCREYCRRDTSLWPIFNGSSVDRDYRKFVDNLHKWRYDTYNETYRNCW